MHVLRLATRRPMLQVTPALGHIAHGGCSTLHECIPLAPPAAPVMRQCALR